MSSMWSSPAGLRWRRPLPSSPPFDSSASWSAEASSSASTSSLRVSSAEITAFCDSIIASQCAGPSSSDSGFSPFSSCDSFCCALANSDSANCWGVSSSFDFIPNSMASVSGVALWSTPRTASTLPWHADQWRAVQPSVSVTSGRAPHSMSFSKNFISMPLVPAATISGVQPSSVVCTLTLPPSLCSFTNGSAVNGWPVQAFTVAARICSSRSAPPPPPAPPAAAAASGEISSPLSALLLSTAPSSPSNSSLYGRSDGAMSLYALSVPILRMWRLMTGAFTRSMRPMTHCSSSGMCTPILNVRNSMSRPVTIDCCVFCPHSPSSCSLYVVFFLGPFSLMGDGPIMPICTMGT
mmetsp:Transcript_124574/g.302470  ORF Transcript_124574/g.302470 Transcript_124574/m.302470 type:complete len:352 (-) Transcript_124574:399-1454(-)